MESLFQISHLVISDSLHTPEFWPGEFHGLYRPWRGGHKESDMTDRLSHHLFRERIASILQTEGRKKKALNSVEKAVDHQNHFYIIVWLWNLNCNCIISKNIPIKILSRKVTQKSQILVNSNAPIPKKGNAKECSNYRKIALISHASKVMIKILQASLSSTWTMNFQMFKLVLQKAEEPEIKLPTSAASSKSKRVPEKHLFLLYWLCQSLWLCGSQ